MSAAGLLEAAERHHTKGVVLREVVTAAAAQEWGKITPDAIDESFGSILPTLMEVITLGQLRAASEADSYLTRLYPSVDLTGMIRPGAFAGIAADGRDLVSLLRIPLIVSKRSILAGVATGVALGVGAYVLKRIAASETADAGRTADQTATTARPELSGYVRHLSLPSCARCAVLAGQVYQWNDGFERHPQCDCRHIPIRDDEDAEELRTDARKAIEAGKVRDLSQADRKAILEGADPNQVINARRGMYKASDGRKLTREGMTKRAWYGGGYGNGRGRDRRPPPRLRPEQIYRDAGSRKEAISLLREHGYFVD